MGVSTGCCASTCASGSRDRLVLTFGQIEDLLGFALPGLARVDREWWDSRPSVADRPRHSDAWIVAGRTASVNLPAQCVTFER